MTETWKAQVRLSLAPPFAEAARRDPADPALAPLPEILARHGATLVCQYDAFAGYVAEAERRGVEQFPLYRWTKDTIEDPAKQAKYRESFTVHLGGDEVYPQDVAQRLAADLEPLAGGPMVRRVVTYDTNPANNPQMPDRYRR